jgi:5-methylcytosine-specific restriction endonuclease McrA
LALTNKALGSKKWKDIRLRVLARDGYVCYICGGEATQVDHVIPRTKMGDMWDMDNLAAICARDNIRKGDKQLGVFLGVSSTPPVFSSNISPMRSEVHQDSPFLARPVPIDGE